MANWIQLGHHFIKGFLTGFEFPVGISIDVTNRCNLRCKHCYFFQQNHKKELSGEKLIEKIKEVKAAYPSIIHASWVGGEPLLRKEIVAAGLELFPFNMVVTNGSLELPNWKNCVFNVSVDGTRKYYEKIRGLKIYDAVKKHADRNDVRVNAACVLNKKNYLCLEDLLAEWKKTKIGGINFDFYTPIRGIKDDLWLNWEERDALIKKLIGLRKKYGDFILNPEEVLELMLSRNSKKLTSDCLVPKAVVCLDPMGRKKTPCVIGPKADCSRCGCVIPFFMDSVFAKKQWGSLPAAKKLFS